MVRGKRYDEISSSTAVNADIIYEACLESITELIDDLDVTTTEISTTILENSVFKTKARQKIEISLINLNVGVPTVLVGT